MQSIAHPENLVLQQQGSNPLENLARMEASMKFRGQEGWLAPLTDPTPEEQAWIVKRYDKYNAMRTVPYKGKHEVR